MTASLIRLLPMLLLGACVANPTYAAVSPGLGPPASYTPADDHCNAPDDLIAWYKSDSATSNDEVYGYKFDGDDGAKIAVALAQMMGPSPAPVVTEWVTIDVTTGNSVIFEYDAKGCAQDYIDAFSNNDVATLLHALGIAPPFGPTFHQLPGLGTRPGINI